MNTTGKTLMVCGVTGIMLAGMSCTAKKENKETAGTQQTVPVKTMVVKQESIVRSIEYTATLNAFEEVHLAPASPGRIEKFTVEIGDHVNKGQVVAYMDRTNLEQSRINLMKLEADFRRLDTLKKTGSIADQQYDQIKSAYEIARTSYQFLLDNTQLKSPFNGIVSGKYFEDGEIYSGAPVPAVGKPAILSIVQINPLKALVGISANYFPVITTAIKADVLCDIYPGMTFKGEIFRVYPTIDNATKTFMVEVKIHNNELKLRPGMFAKIRLHLGKGSAILVPTIALVKQTGTNNMYVFVHRNQKAIKVPVETGRMIDDKTEILKGLKEGDEVIVTGQNKLENGMPVRITN